MAEKKKKRDYKATNTISVVKKWTKYWSIWLHKPGGKTIGQRHNLHFILLSATYSAEGATEKRPRDSNLLPFKWEFSNRNNGVNTYPQTTKYCKTSQTTAYKQSDNKKLSMKNKGTRHFHPLKIIGWTMFREHKIWGLLKKIVLESHLAKRFLSFQTSLS